MGADPSERNSARDLAISLDRGCLLAGGREIKLRAKTFQVLAYLHEHHGRLVAKEDLFRAVWPDTFVSDDSLTKCVREIREALGDRDHQLLKTVARRGFILDAPLMVPPPTPGRHLSAPGEPPESRTHNLPAPLTTFIGRQREIAELARLLPSTRLLTLTGTGGAGKTRLALEVARRVLFAYPDGVWLADLSSLVEPGLVPQTVASVLGIRQVPNRSLLETLSDQLRQRRMLLVLDNCEHVIVTSAELAETLLPVARGLTILATSREALAVAGETTWRVPSLTLPDPQEIAVRLKPDSTNAGDLLQYEAVCLLVERAAAVHPAFEITSDNAATVVEVCRRLDGIPLAIELAAARLNVLSIDEIHARLDDRFRLLTRAPRTPVGRQRTLEATVDWSFDLLSDAERQLLGRLSAFAGGWTLEAAEHVCSDDGIDRDNVLDLMSRLVDKSLVIVDEEVDRRRRYRYLETVRQYAWERLRQTGEADAVRARHFGFFLELARRAEPELVRAEQLRWLDRLQAEHGNFRAALDWRLMSDRAGAESMELAAALHWFWVKRAYLAEGQQWLERALARSTAPAGLRRAQGLLALGSIVFFQGDFARAQGLLEESAAMARAAGEPAIVALAVGLCSITAIERGDLTEAVRTAAESAAAARAAGEPWLEGFSLTCFAYEALFAGDIDRAGQLHEQNLALSRAQRDLWGLGIVLFDLALLRVVQHRHAEARAMAHEGIALGRQFDDRRAIAWHFGILAGTEASEGRALPAARLHGAMEGLLDSIGSEVQPTYTTWIGDRLFGAVQQELGTDAYQQALAAGRAMSLSQALEYAASLTPPNVGVFSESGQDIPPPLDLS